MHYATPSRGIGVWNQLECYCRELTKEWDVIHVFTGSIMMPKISTDSNGNQTKVVTYQVKFFFVNLCVK